MRGCCLLPALTAGVGADHPFIPADMSEISLLMGSRQKVTPSLNLTLLEYPVNPETSAKVFPTVCAAINVCVLFVRFMFQNTAVAIFRTVHPKINRKDKARDSGPVTRGSDPRLSSKNATPFLIVVVLLPAYNTVVTFSDERNSGTFTGLAGARDRARHPGLRASSAAAYSTLNSHIRNRTNVTSCRVSFGLFRN
ncbi:hypothetical protein J6590_106226, partial [Homalodisca vitripennis]